MFTTGNKSVDAIGSMNLEGNVIPHKWFEHLRFTNGKPDLPAIIILSEILYWHRPELQKDELTGQLLGMKKRFKADLLQRSYDSFADQFGITKRQAKEAIYRLEEGGYIKRHLRTFEVNGTKLGNVLFLELLHDNVIGMTFQRQRGNVQTSEVSHPNVSPVTVGCQTNTEITTEITTNINNDDNKHSACAEKNTESKLSNAFEFYQSNGFGALGPFARDQIFAWIDDMTEPLVIKAMEKAVIQGNNKWSYAERILKDWSNKGLLTLEAVAAEDLRWEANKQQKQVKPQSAYKRGREEKVPEWFHNRNQDNAQSAPVAAPLTQDQIQQFEAERQKILGKIGKD